MTKKTLTEKWEAGDLPYIDWLKTNPEKGYYWVKLDEDSEPSIDEYTNWYDSAGNPEIKFSCQPMFVLYPVPTYEETVAHDDKCCCFRNEVLEVENAKLKEKLYKAIERLKITIDLLTDPDCISDFRDAQFIALRISQTLEEIGEI